MFALRASCSSTWSTAAKRPSLVAYASRKAFNRPKVNPHPTSPEGANVPTAKSPVSEWLEQGEETEPTPFKEVDAPPTMSHGIARRETPSVQLANLPKYRLHCHATRNNTITTFTKEDGSTISWASGGSMNFKSANRSSYEAGYKCAVTMFAHITELYKQTPFKLELFFKGFGEGREAMKTALLGVEGEFVRDIVIRVTDRTPLKIGGTRAKKTRRG